MKKQFFTFAFCGVLLLLVGLLWRRVQELEKSVNSLRYQPVANSKVVWQNDQQSNAPENKQVFKLIESSEIVDPDKSKVGVPWNVERAMMRDTDRSVAPTSTGEWHWNVVPDQPNSK